MIDTLRLLLFLLLSSTWLHAQTNLADSTILTFAEANARAIYKNRIVDNVHLYEGVDYKPYQGRNDQHPYFNINWSVGSVFYNGSLYTEEEILYDILNDKVIIQDYFGGSFIQLVSEKVDYFYLDGHKFVWIADPTIKAGFYDLLVDDVIKLYVRRSKEFKQVISASEVVDEFKEINKYYLVRNNTFYPIKNKRSVRTVLSDYEEKINQLIRDQNLQFRDSFEESVILLTRFCNAQ